MGLQDSRISLSKQFIQPTQRDYSYGKGKSFEVQLFYHLSDYQVFEKYGSELEK